MPASFRIQVSVPFSTRIPVWRIARIRILLNVRILKQMDGYCARVPLVIVALVGEARALAMTDHSIRVSPFCRSYNHGLFSMRS